VKLAIDTRMPRCLCRDDRELFAETLQILADQLPGVLRAVCQQVVYPGCQLERVVSHEFLDDLKPFVRLLLLDLKWSAKVPGWSPTMRVERAQWALEMAGFPKPEQE
jgi:hypothetical protein